MILHFSGIRLPAIHSTAACHYKRQHILQCNAMQYRLLCKLFSPFSSVFEFLFYGSMSLFHDCKCILFFDALAHTLFAAYQIPFFFSKVEQYAHSRSHLFFVDYELLWKCYSHASQPNLIYAKQTAEIAFWIWNHFSKGKYPQNGIMIDVVVVVDDVVLTLILNPNVWQVCVEYHYM